MFGIVVLVLCYHLAILTTSASPVSSELPSPRLPRELIECCPCPGSRESQGRLGDQLARAEDDCPCRPRADSEGASSLFYPAALRPDASQTRPTDPKEDPKNLLEPEVALATSVLDTLREATEEEYQDALEREAVRSAAEPDAVPEESARNVVFILNPTYSENDEDFLSDASHVQESRCIHPLGRTSKGSMRSSTNLINILPEPFKLPKLKPLELPHRNLLHFDSDLGASSVEESIVDPNRNVLKSSLEAPGFGHTISLKNPLDNQNGGLRLRKPNLMLGKLNDKESIEGSKLLLMPKLKEHKINIVDDDLRSAASNVRNQSDPTTDKKIQLLNHDKLPLTLRNLLKLRDVELIPKTIRNKTWVKPKIDISKFAIPTLFKSSKNYNCKEEAKDKAYTLETINPDQREITDTNGEMTNTWGMKQTEEINPREYSIRENTPFDEIVTDSNLNEYINDSEGIYDTEKQELDLDTLTSPSQVQSSFIDTPDREFYSETVVSPNNVCNSLNLIESDINKESQETKFSSTELGNAGVVTEDSSNFKDDTKASEFLQNQDSETDSNHAILFSLAPLENIINEPKENQENTDVDFEIIEKDGADSKVTPQSFSNTLENGDVISHVREMPSLSETLSNLRENVVKQLENLKKPSMKSGLRGTFSKNYIINNDIQKVISSVGSDNQIITNLNPKNEDDAIKDTDNIFITENVNNISMSDLQNMSDKLLDANINEQGRKKFLESTASSIKDKFISKESEINNKSDSELSETKLNSIVTERETNANENACLTNLEIKNANSSEEKVTKSVVLDTKPKEMDTEASNTVINTLPGILDSLNPNSILHSPLLTDISLPPPSDPLNLLGKPLGDVLNLNTNLPTLDVIREQLGNIFNIDSGSEENDSSSIDADFTNDPSLETMATEASTRTSQKELPLLKQLGDLNHNIYNTKPKISKPFDTRSRMIDLNSYRAHLPSPNSLDLKPLKIEPKVRSWTEKNKPPVDFGLDRTIQRKAKPSTLDNRLGSFTTLEELRNALRPNTRNLLDSPIHSDLNLLPENLRSNDIADIVKNFRLNTEKTFKGLQRKMKSSLKKPKLTDSLAKPQELLDDMNDKLKGIHYDLNDRLSSFRESIIDSTRLRTVEQPRKAPNRNVMSNMRKYKPKTTRLQTSASTTNQEIDSIQPGLEPRKFISPDWNRLQKQIVAESAPKTERVETPKSINAPSSYFHRMSPVFRQNLIATEPLQERTPTQYLNRDVNFKDIKNPLIRTATTPFNNQRQQNKVTISFGTTTARPSPPPRTIIDENNPQRTSFGSKFCKENESAKSKASLIRFKPLRTSAPLTYPIDEDYEVASNNFSHEDFPSIDTKSKSSLFREMSKPDLKIHHNPNRLKSANIFEDKLENHLTKSAVKTSDWPRVTKNSFLSKVRDATNMRKLTNASKPTKDVKTEQLDMLRSPTENTDIVIDEPLKENISYRCKMVCTKEIK